MPCDADLAFDWPGGRLRHEAEIVERMASCDTEELAEAGDPADMPDDRAAELVTAHMRSMLTPQLYVYCMRDTAPDNLFRSAPNIVIFDAHTDAAVSAVTAHCCFDVRSVGLFNFWVFGGQTHVMGSQLPDVCFHLCDLDIAIGRLLERPVIAIECEGEFTTFRFRGDMTITLNESRDFKSVLHDDTRGTPGPDRIRDTVRSTVQWEQIDDVWVPTDFMIKLLNANRDGSVLRHTHTMEWSQVNQQVPDHYVDSNSFPDVLEHKLVDNHRSEEPVQIGEWPGGQFVAIEPAEHVIPQRLAEPKGRPGNRLPVTNSAILFLLLGGTLAICLFRRQGA